MAKTAAAEPAGAGGRGRLGLQGKGSTSASPPPPPPHPTLASIGRSRTFTIEKDEEGENKHKSEEDGCSPAQQPQPSAPAAAVPAAVPTPAPRERRARPGRPTSPGPPAHVLASTRGSEQGEKTAAPVPAPRRAVRVPTAVEPASLTTPVEGPRAPESAAREEARKPGPDGDVGRGAGRRRLLRRQEAGDSSSSDAESGRGRGGQKVVLVTEAEIHHPPSSPSAKTQDLRKVARQEPGGSRRGSAIQGALLDEIKRISQTSQASEDSARAGVEGQEGEGGAGRPDTAGDALLEDSEEQDDGCEGGAGRPDTAGDVLLEAYEEPAAVPAVVDAPAETDDTVLTPYGAPGDELADQPDGREVVHAEPEASPEVTSADHPCGGEAQHALVQEESSETTPEQHPPHSTGAHSPILEEKTEDLSPRVTAPDTPLHCGKAPDHDPPRLTTSDLPAAPGEDHTSSTVTVPEALEHAEGAPADQTPAVTVSGETPPPPEPAPGDPSRVTTPDEAASPLKPSATGSAEGAPRAVPREAEVGAEEAEEAEDPGEALTASPRPQAATMRTLHPLDDATRERLQKQIERAVLSAVAGPPVSREALQAGLDQASAALNAFYATPTSEAEAVRLRAEDLLQRVLRLKEEVFPVSAACRVSPSAPPPAGPGEHC